MLDLSHIILNEFDIARFARKAEAKALARARNWNSCDVVQAFNRFNIFWVVGERLENNLRLATRSGEVVFIPYREVM
jgi:hypothetical protein